MRTLVLVWLLVPQLIFAGKVLVPMDEKQTDHLKAYGIAYWVLKQGIEVDWLLNYRGGSFMFEQTQKFVSELHIRNVSYELLSDGTAQAVKDQIASPATNMDVVKLEVAPKVCVYSPKSKQPWDDAVTLVLSYSEIPYDVIFDDEVMNDQLSKYDWLHLHHEDFTGQYGRFFTSYQHTDWYKAQQREAEETAAKYGYTKVSKLKLEVVQRIRAFCVGGGFLFAMCSATDTYDIALAAHNTDICEYMYDGDPADPAAQEKLDFHQTLAFKDFKLVTNPFQYEYSNIDMREEERPFRENNDYFKLFQFSAKWDPIPTMLTQNHANLIKGFMGQTTAFRKELIKSDVVIMGEAKEAKEARYIHGVFGKGFWTFYGGHDPEDYKHFVGEEPTDLSLHPNSPGYRLILNNILFPAAKKKKQRT